MTTPEDVQRVLREAREAREREATLRLPLDGELVVGPSECLDRTEPSRCKNNPRSHNGGRGLCAKHYKRLENRVKAGETTWLAEETAGRCRPAQNRGESSPWRFGGKRRKRT